MFWDAHLVAGFCEEAVVFRASFLGSWFDSIGADGQAILGNNDQHVGNESFACPGFVFGRVDYVSPMTQSVQGAFKAQGAKRHMMNVGGLLHEHPDHVIGDEMEGDFLVDHRWRLTAQDVEPEDGLDFPEVEFNGPASEVEFCRGPERDTGRGQGEW